MALGIFNSALKTFPRPNLSFIISLAVAIGVVYTCVSPWLDDNDSDDVLDNLDCETSISSPVTKIRVKKRRIVKFVPELMEISQKNQDDVSTEFLSFKFGSENSSQLKSNFIYAKILKSKGTQTDSVLGTIDNYIDSNDLHSSIEYREIRRNDPAEIGVSNRQTIVKPPRKHPPVSRAEKPLVIKTNECDRDDCSKSKLCSSLYPEVHVIHNEDSKSFKSVIDRNDYQKFSSAPSRKLSYLEVTKLVEAQKSISGGKKSKPLTSLIKKCRRMLNFNDFEQNVNGSESKSPSKSWSSITSALGSQPAGHSTLIDVNLSGEAGGQDEEYNSSAIKTRPNPPKSDEKVFSPSSVNFHSQAKNVVVEMNSDQRPESRILDQDDFYHNYCSDGDFDLLPGKNRVYCDKESSRVAGFTRDLHQFMKDVKSYFKIPHNYHDSISNNNDNIGWIKMSSFKRDTSVTLFNGIEPNTRGCYSFL